MLKNNSAGSVILDSHIEVSIRRAAPKDHRKKKYDETAAEHRSKQIPQASDRTPRRRLSARSPAEAAYGECVTLSRR